MTRNHVACAAHDASRLLRYYNDLWELDLDTLKWSALGAAGALAPPPRSGCQLALHAEAGTLFMYGGYRKEPGDDDVELGVALAACWALDLTKYTWERVKKQGIAPGPRSGFTMVAHRNRAVLFGAMRMQWLPCVSSGVLAFCWWCIDCLLLIRRRG